MSEICESLINDYLSGGLSRSDIEDGLSSIFQLSNSTSTQAQLYLHQLYKDNKLTDEQFKDLSGIVSEISINTTLNGSKATTDISYFNEDKTLHLTDLSESGKDSTNSSDQTVIIRTDTAMPVTDYSIDKSIEISADNNSPSENIIAKKILPPPPQKIR